MALSGNIAGGVIKIALAGYEAAKTQLTAIGAQAKKAGEAMSTIGNASLKGFAVATGSIVGLLKAADPVRFEIFTQKLQVLAMYIGSAFIPILDDAIAVLDQLIEYFKNLTDEQRETILHWTKIGVAVLAAGAALGAVVAVLPKLIGLMRAVQVVIGLLLSETGLGLVLALVGAAVAVLELTGGMGKLREMLAGTDKSFKSLVSGALAQIVPILTLLADIFQKVFAKLVSVATPILNKIGKVIADTFAKAVPILEKFAEMFGKFFEDLGPMVGQFVDMLSEMFAEIAPIFQQLGLEVLKAAQELGSALMSIVPTVLELVRVFLKLWVAYQATLAIVFQALLQVAVKVIAVVLRLAATLLDVAAKALDPIVKVVENLTNVFISLLPTIMEVVNVLAELATSLVEVAAQFIRLGIEAVGAFVGELAKLAAQLWKTFGPDITNFLKGCVNLIKQSLEYVQAMIEAAKRLSAQLNRLNPFGGRREPEGPAPFEMRTGGKPPVQKQDEAGPGVGGIAKIAIDAFDKIGKKPQFMPLPPVQRVENYGLEEAFKKAQQGAAFDPTKIAENERKQWQKDMLDTSKKNEENTRKEKMALRV